MHTLASEISSKVEFLPQSQTTKAIILAAQTLSGILKPSYGPQGSIKMLIDGAGKIQITKDAGVLLKCLSIQNPIAAMIARAAVTQDKMVGDGTASLVILIAELLRQAEMLLEIGLHPKDITEGFEQAKNYAIEIYDSIKIKMKKKLDRDILLNIAQTALVTKVAKPIALKISSIVVDSVINIVKKAKNKSFQIDLHMIEVMHIKCSSFENASLIQGLVLDHGSRHPDMPKNIKNCYILTCNINLEYEKTEINSKFVYSSAEQGDKLLVSERKVIDERVSQIIELKRQVCKQDENFVVINQKGIDPVSLDQFSKEGILALRRAKKRNMERITLACGGNAVNSLENIEPKDLGFAGLVYEEEYGEEKYTFITQVPSTLSCTILIKAPDDHTIDQIREAIRDGLNCTKHAILDKSVLPGGGASEIVANVEIKKLSKQFSGKIRQSINSFAQALLILPITLLTNAGMDDQEFLSELIQKYERTDMPLGVDCITENIVCPEAEGIVDNFQVKKQMLNLATSIVQQLISTDNIISCKGNK